MVHIPVPTVDGCEIRELKSFRVIQYQRTTQTSQHCTPCLACGEANWTEEKFALGSYLLNPEYRGALLFRPFWVESRVPFQDLELNWWFSAIGLLRSLDVWSLEGFRAYLANSLSRSQGFMHHSAFVFLHVGVSFSQYQLVWLKGRQGPSVGP